jgi:hypothetical protein
MRFAIIILTLLLQSTFCFSQKDILTPDSSCNLEKKIQGNFIYINTDLLGNIYAITKSGQLRKMNAAGDSIASYNEVKKYGQPTMVDVSNPMKILVFYKPYGIIVSLDRLMTFRNSINLRNKQYFNVNSAATSYDNLIWIFDGGDQKIKKLDDEGGLISEGQDLRLVTEALPESATLLTNQKQLLLYDAGKGFYVFDILGGYRNLLPFKDWQDVGISGNIIYGFQKGKLLTYELQTLHLKEYVMPAISNSNSMKVMNGKLYLLKDDGIEVYTIKTN